MKFSIIVPVFNRAGTIGRALQSLIAQTYSNFEVVVVDDGSGDGSAAVAEGYTHDARFKVVRLTTNVGVNAARNFGFDYISDDSDWVTFLDSDDEFLPDALALMINDIKANPGYLDYCFSVIDHRGNLCSRVAYPPVYMTYQQQVCSSTRPHGEWVHTLDASLVRSGRFRYPIQVRNGFESIAYLELARYAGTLYSASVVRRYYLDSEGLTRVREKSREMSRNGIAGYELFFEKYGSDFRSLAPKEYARYMAVLGKYYIECGMRRQAMSASISALLVNPTELRVYRNIAAIVSAAVMLR
jgi:glycosyltransferase involved in cell wall biosynthesis